MNDGRSAAGGEPSGDRPLPAAVPNVPPPQISVGQVGFADGSLGVLLRVDVFVSPDAAAEIAMHLQQAAGKLIVPMTKPAPPNGQG